MRHSDLSVVTQKLSEEQVALLGSALLRLFAAQAVALTLTILAAFVFDSNLLRGLQLSSGLSPSRICSSSEGVKRNSHFGRTRVFRTGGVLLCRSGLEQSSRQA